MVSLRLNRASRRQIRTLGLPFDRKADKRVQQSESRFLPLRHIVISKNGRGNNYSDSAA